MEKISFAEIKEAWLKKTRECPKLRKRLVRFLGAFYWQLVP